MMLRLNRKKKNKGQTALEYALVIGVITMGVILAGRVIFAEKDSLAQDLMERAVKSAGQTLEEK